MSKEIVVKLIDYLIFFKNFTNFFVKKKKITNLWLNVFDLNIIKWLLVSSLPNRESKMYLTLNIVKFLLILCDQRIFYHSYNFILTKIFHIIIKYN